MTVSAQRSLRGCQRREATRTGALETISMVGAGAYPSKARERLDFRQARRLRCRTQATEAFMPQAGRVGDNAHNPSDGHSCPGCDHSVEGPAKQGSPDVFVNGRPVLRVGDPGEHSGCCGSNTWQAADGSPGVFVNGQRLHRVGDATEHCGGQGQLVQGSPNVFIGDKGPGSPKPEPHDRSVTLNIKDAMGRSLQEVVARVTCPHKNYEDKKFSGTTTISGLCSGASVEIVKALQKGEWDKGAETGHAIAPTHSLMDGDGGGGDGGGGDGGGGDGGGGGAQHVVHAPSPSSTPAGKGTSRITVPRAKK
jgi:uncharacterized Zn-binding protein involved in type VI secretion